MKFAVKKKHVALSVSALVMLTVIGGFMMGLVGGPSNCFMVTMPPQQYDYRPAQRYKTVAVSHLAVDETCRQYADFSYMRIRLQACTITSGDGVTMVIPNDMDPVYTSCLVRHENGHVNGWPASHPGARHFGAPGSDNNRPPRTSVNGASRRSASA